ncbi:hypothetical protein AB1Y20_001407 [Prymnesium parvum]|uniref:Uncharacterized protein n=1 Tax=Prymnesium parvum TaxID=97485 RepID=A0AB34KCG7_PRYPA
MLFADKRALETNLKVNLLAIREKELNYYTQNCLAVCTQSALLAGFAYSGLTQVAIPEDAGYVLKLLYLIVTTTAMCLELIAVMNTTLLSMMGPGLALRGPDGSMHPAVEGMVIEYNTAYICFVLGLIAFHFSAALFAWLMFTWGVAFFVSSCVVSSLYMLMRYASRVFNRFRTAEVVTGRFSGEEMVNSEGSAPPNQRDLASLITGQQTRHYNMEQASLAEAQRHE